MEPELPRKEEIMAREPPSLPHNKVDAPPESKAQYLESQYRLLRYEATELLRRAVQEFREDPDMEESKNTAIYTNVSSILCSYSYAQAGHSAILAGMRIASLSNPSKSRWSFMAILPREWAPSAALDFVPLASTSVSGGSTLGG